MNKNSLSTVRGYLVKKRPTDVWKLRSARGGRTEAMQKCKNTLNLLAVVIHKNKRNAAGNSEKIL